MIRRFIQYYKPEKKWFFMDMLCCLIAALCDLYYPALTRQMINVYVPAANVNALVISAVLLLAVYIVKLVMNYITAYYGHMIGTRMQANMRRDMFEKLQHLPFSFFDETKTGTVMSRMMNDLFDVSELAHHGPENLFLSIVMFIGSFIVLANINIWLTLIIFAFLPFVIAFALLMRKKMRYAFKLSREKVAEVNAEVETAISGIRVTRAYTASEHELSRFDAENSEFVHARKLSYKAMGQFHSVMTFCTDFMYLVVICAGGAFFINNKIDVGDFAAYLLYISVFLSPLRRIIDLFEQLQSGMTGFRRFAEIIDAEIEPEKPNATDCGELKGEISFNDVSFTYGDANGSDNVINHLDLHLSAGRTVALVGPSGGGKTTICNLIPRFYELTEGSISIDGQDITDMKRASLRRNIGIVAQDVFLFNGSIKENIAYGKPNATDEEIIDAAKKANIHDFILTLPKGYDTNVGERGAKLSGGQKQRVSIARVFLKNPPILILDEATSALDNATEMLIQKSLEELSKGRTVLVVAHRLSTVKNADEIIVITSDGVIERGTHDELMKKEGMYAGLYKYQFRE